MPLLPETPLDPGDIYWITLPIGGDGSEQHGRRPCIVMCRRALNLGNTVVVVPMSTSVAKANSHKILLPANEIIKDLGCQTEIQHSVALCSQLRVVDKRLFETKIGKLTQNAVLAVQLGITYLFDIR
jgi:mRNA-degrading endonuclease toxin of MazEF toxin-antitoxin module